MLDIVITHLKEHVEHHLAAVGGSLTSLTLTGFSMGGYLQAVCVGFTLFCLTSLTKWLVKKIWK